MGSGRRCCFGAAAILEPVTVIRAETRRCCDPESFHADAAVGSTGTAGAAEGGTKMKSRSRRPYSRLAATSSGFVIRFLAVGGVWDVERATWPPRPCVGLSPISTMKDRRRASLAGEPEGAVSTAWRPQLRSPRPSAALKSPRTHV